MYENARYPDPVVVRVRPLRVLAVLLPVAAMTAAAILALATTPGLRYPAVFLATAFFCVLTVFLVALAIRRPVRFRLTPEGILSDKAFCAWDEVIGVSTLGSFSPRAGLSLVFVAFAASLAAPSPGGQVAEGRTLVLNAQMTMNRRRMAAMIIAYQNAWAAHHGRAALLGAG